MRRVLAAIALLAAASAAAQQAAESTVKAAFLYKFAGYVEWPAAAFRQPDTPIVIGVLGSDEVASELERLLPNRTINNRRVLMQRVKDVEGLRGIHMLFVGRGEGRPAAHVRAAQQQGILAVTEGELGLELGSTINFVLVEDRVGFEVSLDAAEKAGLKISSRMLAVARRVVPRP